MTSGGGSLLPRLQMAAAAALFATGGVAIKATALDAWQVAAGRSLIAALLFAAIWRVGPLSISRAGWIAGAFYGATMVGFVVANKLTTAANSIFLQNTAPLYVLALAPLLLGEARHRVDGFVAALLAAGMLCFFSGVDPVFDSAPNPGLGNVIAAVDGIFWAGTLLSLRWLSAREPDAVPGALVLGNLIAVAVALPMSLPVAGTSRDLAAVVYLGAFQIVAAYLFMVAGMRKLVAFEASMLLMLEPVISSVLAWGAYGERPGTASLLGCLLILSATTLKTLVASRASRRAMDSSL